MEVSNALERSFYLFQYKTVRDTHALPVEYYHTHRGIEILYVYEGNGHAILEDRFYEIAPRTLLIFKPFQLHYIHMDRTSKYVTTLLKVRPTFLEQCAHVLPHCHDLISSFLNQKRSRQIFQLNEEHQASLDERYRNLDGILRTSPRYLHNEAVILFLLNFFIDFIANIMPAAQAGRPVKPLRSAQSIYEVLKWIDAHYKKQLTLDQIAEELHYSPNYLSKLFRRQTGISIPEYLTEKRLEQARILLHTHQSVEEISKETGFNSPSYFIRVFKKKFGVTPHQYRLSLSQMYPSPNE